MKKFVIFFWLTLLASLANAEPTALTTLTDINGKTYTLFAQHAQADLIFVDALCPMPHFPGCEAFIADLAEHYNADQHNGYLVFNTFYVDAATIVSFVKKHQLTLPVIIDSEMVLHQRFSIHGTPYQITLNKNGSVNYRGTQLILTQE